MIRLTQNEVDKKVEKIKDVFSDHIGMNNPISTELLFKKITDINPHSLDRYEREYKWNALKRILSVLRKNGELFVVMGNNRHYFLNDKDEVEQ